MAAAVDGGWGTDRTDRALHAHLLLHPLDGSAERGSPSLRKTSTTAHGQLVLYEKKERSRRGANSSDNSERRVATVERLLRGHSWQSEGQKSFEAQTLVCTGTIFAGSEDIGPRFRGGSPAVVATALECAGSTTQKILSRGSSICSFVCSCVCSRTPRCTKVFACEIQQVAYSLYRSIVHLLKLTTWREWQEQV